jgi:hypothetical protein
MSAIESTFENAGPTKDKCDDTEDGCSIWYYAWKYIRKYMIYISIFALFTSNLIAVSISIQCNRNKSIFLKIASAIYAFFFGFMYIIFNYYFYRISIKGDYTSCNFCRENPFSF